MSEPTREGDAASGLRWWHHVAYRLVFLASFALVVAGVLEGSTFDCAMAWFGLFLSGLLRDEYRRSHV